MNIWVGIDGSGGSKQALYWAHRFASQNLGTNESSLHIRPVMSWNYPTLALAVNSALPSAEAMTDATLIAAQKMVDEAALEPASGIELEDPLIVQGEAHHVLADLAEPQDLIVVGSRGLGGFKAMILGSVTSRLAGTARSPLAIIPPGWSVADPSVGSVVVGVDSSGPSRAAALWAAQHCGGSALRLVHSWSVPEFAYGELVSTPPGMFELEAKELVESFAHAIGGEVADGVDIESVIAQGDARSALLAEAEEADLLVLGAQRYHGVLKAILGSTAQSVIHHINAPTVLIPGDEEIDG